MEYVRVKVTYYKTYTAEDLEVVGNFLNDSTVARNAADMAYEEFMNIVGAPPDETEVDFIEVG